MIENAVQDHADTARIAAFDQFFKIRLVSEERIDLHIIARIVAVIGISAEDRVQINDGYIERRKIIELFRDPRKIAAEKVVVQDLPLCIHAVFGHLVPILMQPLPLSDRNILRPIKAVGKDLVHDAPLEPGRRGKFFGADKQLI